MIYSNYCPDLFTRILNNPTSIPLGLCSVFIPHCIGTFGSSEVVLVYGGCIGEMVHRGIKVCLPL